jgi:hypothetical protein
MKTRDVVIYTGKRFEVPQGIQRIDSYATHGWQLRYGGTKLYSDGADNPKGAQAALAQATEELLKRIARLPAPSSLQNEPNQNKTSDLPVGISGPIVRKRSGSSLLESNLSVLLPRFGRTPLRRSVYIGTENTYTEERYHLAVAKCVKLRDDAEKTYRREATTAKRAAGLALAAKQAKRAAKTSKA